MAGHSSLLRGCPPTQAPLHCQRDCLQPAQRGGFSDDLGELPGLFFTDG